MTSSLSLTLPDEFNEQACLVAVSGGPDSMAMLDMLNKAKVNIYAVTFDHQLRKESYAEAVMVHNWCSENNIKHEILFPAEPINKRNIMQAARIARYRAFNDLCLKHGISFVFIGHHLDDQIEHFFMQLARTPGAKGLGGLNERKHYGNMTLYRPLLHIEKQQLVDYCHENKIPYVNDPSNYNTDRLRAKTRANLPAMMKTFGYTKENIIQIMENLRRANDAINHHFKQYISPMYHTCIINLTADAGAVKINTTNFDHIPTEIRYRIIDHALRTVNERYHNVPLRQLVAIDDLITSNTQTVITSNKCKITIKSNHIVIEKEFKDK